jgi:hypothetical protein
MRGRAGHLTSRIRDGELSSIARDLEGPGAERTADLKPCFGPLLPPDETAAGTFAARGDRQTSRGDPCGQTGDSCRARRRSRRSLAKTCTTGQKTGQQHERDPGHGPARSSRSLSFS